MTQEWGVLKELDDIQDTSNNKTIMKIYKNVNGKPDFAGKSHLRPVHLLPSVKWNTSLDLLDNTFSFSCTSNFSCFRLFDQNYSVEINNTMPLEYS